MTHDDYVEILKDTLLKQALESSYSYIISKATFLAWGPLAPILKFILEKILIVFITKTELAIYLQFTDFRVSSQGREFSKAIEVNMKAQKSGNKKEIEIAEKYLKDSFRDLVKLTN